MASNKEAVIWKDIEGYEGIYQISNYGDVRSLNYNHTGEKKLRKQHFQRNYFRINLWKEGKCKRFSVHRLVALHFVEGYKKGLVVHHIDENTKNNYCENLMWVTQKQNVNEGTRNQRLSEKAKKQPWRYSHPGERNGNFSGKSPQARKVVCLTTGGKFECIRDAIRHCGLKSDQGIWKSCRNEAYKYSAGKDKATGKKLYWQYVDGGELNE